MDALEAGALRFSGDRVTQGWVRPTLSWNNYRTGEYTTALKRFDAYLTTTPDPVWEPRT